MPETSPVWLEAVEKSGLVMLGCGNMGRAMLNGWLAAGLSPQCIHVIKRSEDAELSQLGVHVNDDLPPEPAAILLAVKPNIMGEALLALKHYSHASIPFISVAAGLRLDRFEGWLGQGTPIIRAMPNTPSAIGKGVSAIIGNSQVELAMLQIAEGLLSAIGDVILLENEEQMDAATAVSGSGPAYLLYMIECMAEAARALDLPEEMAWRLAIGTISGAGQLAEHGYPAEMPEKLRKAIMAPGGTTMAGLSILMDKKEGLLPLIQNTVATAAARSREMALE